MPYDLQNRLVVGVASSAIFDLLASDAVFRREGEEQYRKHQEANLDVALGKGIAFSFVRRLLSLNDLSDEPTSNPLVEVILLSRNDPDTGMRVMRSIAHYGLPITRAIFMQGRTPYEYIPALNISLFLSGSATDVRAAIAANLPAGQVLDSKAIDDESDSGLRIAFDFDGVLANDESESVMQATKDLNKFHEHEVKNLRLPHGPGPLQQFLIRVAAIQKVEEARRKADDSYQSRLGVELPWSILHLAAQPPFRAGRLSSNVSRHMNPRRCSLLVVLLLLAGPAHADWEVIGAAYKCDPRAGLLVLQSTSETSAAPGTTDAPKDFIQLKEGTSAIVCPLPRHTVQFRVTVDAPSETGMGAGSGSVFLHALSVGSEQLVADQSLGPATYPTDAGLGRIEVRSARSGIRLVQCTVPAALDPKPTEHRCRSQAVRGRQ